MRRIIMGQVLLIICCAFYLIWWYRRQRLYDSVPGAFGSFCNQYDFIYSVYRMGEMKAFYAAMVPLVTEAAAMSVLISVVYKSA